MDIIIEDNVLYRDRKKWMRRLCKLARTNSFSDSVKLLVCTADDGKPKRSSRKLYTPLLSKHVIYGHLHGVHMGNQSNVMYIVCKNTVECLAFEDFDTMKLWSDLLGKHLHDISQFADLVYADKHSQLKNKLEGRLFFNCSHISFIRSPSTCEPKLLMSWKIADIMEYGSKNVDKMNSYKAKAKNSFSDDSQNLFIMKVSPMCQRAPNTHIFSCKDPKQFCSWMENLASNLENARSKNSREFMSQRSRTDSYNSVQRMRTECGESSSPDIDYSNDSPGFKSLRFFPEVTTHQPKLPPYQRSASEIRHRRFRLNSDDGIQENEEADIDDQSASLLSQSDGAKPVVDPESPLSCGTLTWLERYPYERERARNTHTFRRQMSEGAPSTTCSADSTIPWQLEASLPRPKSSNNYCSLLNIRQRNDSSSEASSSMCHPVPMATKCDFSTANLTTERASPVPVPRYVNIGPNLSEYHPGVASSAYANIELDELIQEISDYCRTDNGSVSSAMRT